jgi:hypothetical protein
MNEDTTYYYFQVKDSDGVTELKLRWPIAQRLAGKTFKLLGLFSPQADKGEGIDNEEFRKVLYGENLLQHWWSHADAYILDKWIDCCFIVVMEEVTNDSL